MRLQPKPEYIGARLVIVKSKMNRIPTIFKGSCFAIDDFTFVSALHIFYGYFFQLVYFYKSFAMEVYRKLTRQSKYYWHPWASRFGPRKQLIDTNVSVGNENVHQELVLP